MGLAGRGDCPVLIQAMCDFGGEAGRLMRLYIQIQMLANWVTWGRGAGETLEGVPAGEVNLEVFREIALFSKL